MSGGGSAKGANSLPGDPARGPRPRARGMGALSPPVLSPWAPRGGSALEAHDSPFITEEATKGVRLNRPVIIGRCSFPLFSFPSGNHFSSFLRVFQYFMQIETNTDRYALLSARVPYKGESLNLWGQKFQTCVHGIMKPGQGRVDVPELRFCQPVTWKCEGPAFSGVRSQVLPGSHPPANSTHLPSLWSAVKIKSEEKEEDRKWNNVVGKFPHLYP